jgi:hypothetical protein
MRWHDGVGGGAAYLEGEVVGYAARNPPYGVYGVYGVGGI